MQVMNMEMQNLKPIFFFKEQFRLFINLLTFMDLSVYVVFWGWSARENKNKNKKKRLFFGGHQGITTKLFYYLCSFSN